MEKNVFKRPVKIKREPKPINMEPRIVQIPETLTVKQLAEVMGVAGGDVIKVLIKKGQMMTVNQEIDFEAAVAIAENFNVMC
jgi:translation initiation factor IF-2